MEYLKMFYSAVGIIFLFGFYYLEILGAYLFIVYNRKDADDLTWKDLAISGIIAIVTLPLFFIFIGYFITFITILTKSITG